MLQYTPYGARLYRSASDVRSDIREVRAALAEVRQRLDIRDLIVASLQELGHPRAAIPILQTALSDAREALGRLRELECELIMLQEELSELL